MDEFTRYYRLYKDCMLKIEVTSSSGAISIGSGFHLGRGLVATAKHVVEGNSKVRLITEFCNSEPKIQNILFSKQESTTDLAVLETDLDLAEKMQQGSTRYGHIIAEKTDMVPLDYIWDDCLGDQFVTEDVLVLGYPPIPTATDAILVAVKANVNAVIDRYNCKRPHIIVSSVPRGGFSGGPVIAKNGHCIGVLTEALFHGSNPAETGFAVAITNEALVQILEDHNRVPTYLKPYI